MPVIKKGLHILPLLLLLMLLLSLANEARAEDHFGYSKERPLIFAIDIDYAPLEWVDVNGMPHGLDVQMTQELLHRLNVPFTYGPNSWINVKDDILEGRADLGMMVYSSYRKNLTNYSRAVFHLYYQILYRKSDKENFNERDLKGKHIAYLASKPLTDTLLSAGARPTVVSDLPMAIKGLSIGMYDAVICFRYQAHYLLDKLDMDDIETEDMSLSPREYCYVSNNKQLIDAINVELNMMEAEGVIDEIYGDALSMSKIEIPSWLWYVLGALALITLLLFNINQRRHQKQLKREVERAQQSERLKTIFLGNISHALRTPLNAIIGFSQVVIDDKEGKLAKEEYQQMAEHINLNGRQLLYFINELLLLSDFEGNDLLFNRSLVNLQETMNEFAEQTRSKVKPGVKVVVDACEGYVDVDPNLMRLVTMHALNNAARFTTEGTITLSCYPKDNGLRIDVKDTGCGLPEELKDNIFSMLSERNAYVRENVPGLGLTICKAVIDRVGGKIGAESPPEGGTLLWHWIPRKVKNNN
jgi:signal transduction histidine kinase